MSNDIERKTVNDWPKLDIQSAAFAAIGWNECIDEIERRAALDAPQQEPVALVVTIAQGANRGKQAQLLIDVPNGTPLYMRAPAQTVPTDVLAAVERMCLPLDKSWLTGVTADADAHSMATIKQFINSIGAPPPAAPVLSDEATPMDVILFEVVTERAAQDAQWGGAHHDDQHTFGDFTSYISKQVNRINEIPTDRRERFIKIAALAVAAVESIDRQRERNGKARDQRALLAKVRP